MNKKLGLCEGRHNIKGIDEYIFGNTIDPTDLQEMGKTIHGKLQYCKKLDLYVTGLTVGLIAVVNYCCINFIKLTLYHYNRETASYYSQEVETQVGLDCLQESNYM